MSNGRSDRPHRSLLSVEATATGGRGGSIASSDGKFKGVLAFPRELGGDGNGISPEHLFAAGHAACFATPLHFAAKSLGVEIPMQEIRVTCRVTMQQESNGSYRLASDLMVDAPGLTNGRAEEVLAETHTICMYSRALAGHADVSATLAGPK